MLYWITGNARSSASTHWSEFERGGHVAAEAPDLFGEDVRAFFGDLH
jgi:hypothetical protein